MKSPKVLASQTLERLGYRVEKLRSDEALYDSFPREALEARRFINVGAGQFRHRYWTNVDFATEWYGPVQTPGFVNYDLTSLEPLPFDDQSIELAYSSHTIEHVADEAVENLLRECHRVLRPGGGLRITCPDAMLMYQTVADNNLAYWHWRHQWFRGPLSTAAALSEVTVYDYFVREVATRRCRFYSGSRQAPELVELEALFAEHEYPVVAEKLVAGLRFDSTCPGDHINYWDEQRLIEMLRRTGFANAYTSRRGQSRFAPMMVSTHFDRTMPLGSLYVEARKG